MSDLFSAEQLLIDRIKTKTTDFVTVANPSAISGLTNFSGVLPACIIAPGKSVIDSQEMRGNFAIEEQFWDVVVIVTHQIGDSGTEQLASSLMSSVIKALSNFDLGEGFVRPMNYNGRPENANYALTFAEFVMSFKVKKIVGI